ncbi:hypothetical protein CROQUDRAFT_449074 [Cronartium quercuum f. sp. fusiforme G11]|uniref:Uncharacterized protein n=1 Tax=Cronartium quercuum f. sp. fusiforme G11 TaxID=708437 RepID=A0A9P6NPA7_9BASI|nr:hypothetical protein CROQUDRAFT_449074 [Cronartium quercuum f. sp. fusiforme G11]
MRRTSYLHFFFKKKYSHASFVSSQPLFKVGKVYSFKVDAIHDGHPHWRLLQRRSLWLLHPQLTGAVRWPFTKLHQKVTLMQNRS